MKAKDLAALAALGVAGYAAYDKFGKKNTEAKTKKKPVDEDTFRSDAGMRPDAEVRDNAKRSRQENDIPEALSRQERDVPDRIMGRDAAGSRFTDKAAAPVAVASPVRTPVVESRSLDSVGGPSRYNRAADSNAAGAQMPDAARVTPYNPDIMYNTTVARDESIPHDDEMNRLARTRATRQGAVVSQSPNAQAQARILRQGPTPTQSATNAQAQARLLRQGAPSAQTTVPTAPAAQTGRYTKDKYGNIIDNVTGKVSRTIFSAGQEGNAARNGMKRGGVVKMASGGKVTSKPSGASRGDGIAQRGRTRGKYL